ncbi:MAG TPA: alcohol dehydrogenase catalytic domain-containing protein [Candidatus Limnocylindria bacterium]|nr:alcohol dehydrogenase catalytic domain-containing protein [Candidatus Limnocylindria bacterium]
MSAVATKQGSYARAVITGPNTIVMEHVPIQTPGAGQVLVRMRASALCTWEQRTFAGIDTFSYPLVGGHENSGVIQAIGPDVELKAKVGDQVALAGLKRCGQCHSCRRGVLNLCDNARSKRVPNAPWGPGGFGEYVLAEAYQVYPVGPVATPLEAALTEPASCVIHDMKRHPVRSGDVVVIVGAGIMGLLHLVLVKKTPCFVIVSEPEPERRAKAKELGADALIDPATEDYVARVNELSGGNGANVTYVAIGVPKAIEAAVAAAAKRGVVSCYASVHPRGSTITVDPNSFHHREVTLSGSIAQDPDDFLAAADIIGRREIDLRPLISMTFPLSRLADAFAAAGRKDTYRVFVQPDAEYAAAQRGGTPAPRS